MNQWKRFPCLLLYICLLHLPLFSCPPFPGLPLPLFLPSIHSTDQGFDFVFAYFCFSLLPTMYELFLSLHLIYSQLPLSPLSLR